ncbi:MULTISPECIES: hypothetical protein [unclassified Micromonospora]|uniref:hypothetical protein n=1 Tax=unclassified Micromonospora TaxID=2617518 RepID=UPI001C225D51|nr:MULTISPECIES: hypothetical protein [unclassified Micromonospora]MBU8857415.1 hypothetical protein [Micromonospora sp. WMMB482]MDM4783038.1 hypothetical protein [Micromonospora sp. b486]
MGTPNDDVEIYILDRDAVRWAIRHLTSRPMHPFFLAYLHLRALAMENGRLTALKPRWSDLIPYIRVPGGPPKKPYFRPMWHKSVEDKSRYWMNRNLAGSFAPSSLREEPRKVIEIENDLFTLKPNHADLALKYLLFDSQLSAAALGAYLFRNFGFRSTTGDPPEGSALVDALKEAFLFDQVDLDFDFETLFDDKVPAELRDPFEGPH